jgi:hypothetical protein
VATTSDIDMMQIGGVAKRGDEQARPRSYEPAAAH